MEARTVGTAIKVLVIAGYGIAAASRGYHRRRHNWTRGSWIGLGVTVLVGLSLLALMLVISFAVDNHESWVGTPHSNTRSGWVLVSLGSMFGGVLLVAGSLRWFAEGQPTRPFPLWGSLLSTRRARSSTDRPASALPCQPDEP
jgi:hypothetical protein